MVTVTEKKKREHKWSMIQNNIFSHQRTQKKGGGGFFYRDRKTRGEKKEVISTGEW